MNFLPIKMSDYKGNQENKEELRLEIQD